MKKYITILVILFLIGSCKNPLSKKQKTEQALSQGKGLFTLSIQGDNAPARTIQPNAGIDYSALYYKLEFINADDEYKDHDFIFNLGYNPTMSVEIAEGVYRLEVTAYKEEGRTTAVARGILESVTITANGATPGTVTLRPIIDGQGTGTFKWNIDTASINGLTQAKMEVIGPYPANDKKTYYFEGVPNDIFEDEYSVSYNDKDDLVSGSYMVHFILARDNSRPIIWPQTLQIYENLESVYTVTFTNDHFLRAIHTVTYNASNGTGTDIVKSYLHGDSITLEPEPASFTAPAGYLFDKWFLAGSSMEEYSAGDLYTVNESVIFYAKWVLEPMVARVASTGTEYAKLEDAITNTVATDTITIIRDITATATYTIPSGKTITIVADNTDRTITLAAGEAKQLFSVASGATLNLGNGTNTKNIILSGGEGVYSPLSNRFGINVEHNSTLNMQSDAVITNFRNTSVGGGVCVSGTFYMYGGSIKGNSADLGGGVYVYAEGAEKGDFIMNGGAISGNTAPYGGGVYVCGTPGGTFTMNGGIIYGNDGNLYDPSGTPNTANSGGASLYQGDGATAQYGATFGGSDIITSGNDTNDTLPSNALFYGWYNTIPYKIMTAAELKGFANIVNGTAPASIFTGGVTRDNFSSKTVSLGDNIDVSAYDNWTPIGTSTSLEFRGTFDGDGYIISNLTIDDDTNEYKGLFGCIGVGSTIKNLGINNANISGGTGVGGITGACNGVAPGSTIIENCFVNGTISGTDSDIGGIVGISTSISTVKNCYTTGTVTGGSNVGGITGNHSGTMENCYSTSVVSGSDYVGGIAGSRIGTIVNNVALNPSVTAVTSANAGRVFYTGTSVNDENKARSDMALLHNNSPVSAFSSATDNDGLDVTPAPKADMTDVFSGTFSGVGSPWSIPTTNFDIDNDLPSLSCFSGNSAHITPTLPSASSISLSAPATHPFASAVYGYTSAPAEYSVTITNTGNEPTSALSISLTGINAGSFTVSPTSVESIASGNTSTFTVEPNIGLSAGTYTATVEVTGTHAIKSFGVSFTVSKANPVVTWPTKAGAFVGDTRSQISIRGESNTTPGNFSWELPGSYLATATNGTNVTRIFTPNDPNYNTLTQSVSVRVIPRNSIKMVYMGTGKPEATAQSNLMNQATGMIRAGGDSTGSNALDYGDLNDGAGANTDFVFLGYTRITDPCDDPITDIIASTTNQSSLSYSSRTYYRFGVQVGFRKFTLYYTTNTNVSPIIDLYVRVVSASNQTSAPSGWGSSGTRMTNNTNGAAQDLRDGASGTYNYLWMRR